MMKEVDLEVWRMKKVMEYMMVRMGMMKGER